MTIYFRILAIAILFIVWTLSVPVLSAQSLPEKSQVISVLKKVNDTWIAGNTNPGNNQWARAAYFTGNLDFYKVYPQSRYLDYALLWAGNNGWTLNGGSSTSNADNQCIGQVYIDLYLLDSLPQSFKIDKITKSIKRMISDPVSDDWWWIDALYMSMPVFARLGVVLNDSSYFEKMQVLYLNTKIERKLYNSETGLWYRDESFAPPYTTPNGLGSYWARGNGWVFAAHARVLQWLPVNHHLRAGYIETFKQMAGALKERQRPDGFWNPSLDDPNDFGGPETSGTSFFTYGMSWGINSGLLDSATYAPVVASAWTGLCSMAVHEDGFLGFVQGVGSNPASSQPVTYNSTADFGVGAFLLAGSEVVKLASGELPKPSVFFIDSVVVMGSQQIGVFFNQQVDPALATNKTCYDLPNLQITGIDLMSDSIGVIITVSDLPAGKYQLVVQGIRSIGGDLIEYGETARFLSTGGITVSASGFEWGTDNTPERTLDFDLNTRWSAEGSGQWIQYDLGQIKTVESVDIAWYKGNERYSRFSLSASVDGQAFKELFNGRSSGTTSGLERYTLNPEPARFVKITGFGNSTSLWNSITETRINTSGLSSQLLSLNSLLPLSIYPSPYTNKGLHIRSGLDDLENYQARIYDSTGKLLAERLFCGNSEWHWPDLQLPEGLCFLIVDGPNYRKDVKFSVKRTLLSP